jgi:molybdopterin-guanine dinucleotide biosynthesis protein A
MFQALDRALNQGRERVLILGSDSPTLPPSHLVRLLSSTADAA